MHKLLDGLSNYISDLRNITIGSSAIGTAGTYANKVANNTGEVFIQTDLLTLLQYGAYGFSIIVGILTIITWVRKNNERKRVIKKEKEREE